MYIKELRKQKHLSQTDLANALNLSKNQILRYENEQTPVPSDILIKIANYFEVSLDFLCSRPFQNKLGYVPQEKLGVIKKLLTLEEAELNRVDAYITALVDTSKNSY